MTILVVEDENIIADDLSRTLMTHGYTVMGVAATGEEAIRLTTQVTPDLIVMDIHLRGKPDGIETIHRIRNELNRAVPTIFLTATRVSKVEKIPVSIVLDKPYLEKELLNAIRRMVPGNHPSTDPALKSSL